MGDRLISCTMAAEMMRAKADMAVPEYKMPFEAAANAFDTLAACRNRPIPAEIAEKLGIKPITQGETRR